MAPKRNKQARISPSPRSKISPQRRSAAAADSDDDDDDDDDEPNELPRDEALVLFFKRPPSAADHVVIVATTQAGEQIVQDRTTPEVRKAPIQFCNHVLTACERTARADNRELRFRATWQSGDRVLASYAWRCGEGDPTALDGTVDSFLRQQQQHGETIHRLALEGLPMLQDGWQKLLASAFKRIDALEKLLYETQDRLRKAGDVEAEILMAHTASDLESRTRTATIVEERLLPLLQHLVLKAASDSTPKPAPPASVLGAAAPAVAAPKPPDNGSNDQPRGEAS
jgi:hypothetical protein